MDNKLKMKNEDDDPLPAGNLLSEKPRGDQGNYQGLLRVSKGPGACLFLVKATVSEHKLAFPMHLPSPTRILRLLGGVQYSHIHLFRESTI